ncbi:MAG: hypothetical protein A3B70_00295 [Deltaproteobacteria bacterium RIFCSPHIGHO2_02_FULL_40_11]|nr:MAG: hypothetical protein A3B70_00295 [Deltaproteobacteria bacterium RIFCSPHIGHO2_02_FULL_40_11]
MKKSILLLCCLFFGISCTKKQPQTDPLIVKGKAVYHAQCTVCHASDPSKDGPLGPAITGASFELLKLRIQSGVYPQGYTPKRATKLMVPMPQITEEQIKALHAFLNQ